MSRDPKCPPPPVTHQAAEALVLLGLFPSRFGHRERVLSLLAAGLGLVALLVARETGAVGLVLLFIVLGTTVFVTVGKDARGLLTMIFNGILVVGIFAWAAFDDGPAPDMRDPTLMVIFVVWVGGPIAVACAVTAIQRWWVQR